MNLIVTLFCAYFLGNIPFGWLIARAKGFNLFEQGSGNIGATNVFRVVGKPYGIACFFLDFAKGFLSAELIPLWIMGASQPESLPYLDLACGAAAILGHNWPVVLRFKGGKGIATSAGVLAAIAPMAVGVALLIWILCMLVSRYVSLSSILAGTTVAISGWVFYGDETVKAVVLTLLGAMAVYRHRANIQRLLKGEELRFGKAKEKQANTDGSSTL